MSGDIDLKISNFVERVMERAKPEIQKIEERFKVAAKVKAAEVLKEHLAARKEVLQDRPTEHIDIFSSLAVNQGVRMPSPILIKILPMIPQLVIAAEVAYQGTTGTGADKLAAVMSAITPLLPGLDSDGVNKVAAYINTIVMIYNMVHPLFQKPTQPAA